MPAIAVVREANNRIPKLTRTQCLIILALAVIGGALVLAANRQTRGGIKVPAATTEPVKPFTVPPGFPIVGPDQHLNGYVYTPHRYPARTGQEVSALVHHGHATVFLPHARDVDWITGPPSEETL